MNQLLKNRIIVVVMLLFFIAWSVLLYTVGATKLVNAIGVTNGLLLVFFIGAFGGLSTITSASFYTTIATLAAGGMAPIPIALAAGCGLMVGDSLFFLFGREARESLPKKAHKRMEKLSKWIDSKPEWIAPVITYLWVGLSPFPNDILMISLALSSRKYRHIVAPLFLGNVTLSFITALLFAI